MSTAVTILLTLFVTAAIVVIVPVGLRRPRNDREWTPDMARLARGELDGDTLTIHNLRDNRYPAPGEPYETRWTDRSYDLSKLRRLWLLVESFSRFRVIAHTFLSFEFDDGPALSVSVEARLGAGERYSVVRGLLRSFEMAYTFGDERDFVLRRAAYRQREMLMVPLITPPDEARRLLLSMVETANHLADHPRFYNSASENCTSVLADHANLVRPGSFSPLLPARVMPGLSAPTLYRKGWLDTDVPLAELEERFAIGERARSLGAVPDFSQRLREGLPTRERARDAIEPGR